MKIVVEFSGWYEIGPENASFCYIGEDKTKPIFIDGYEYSNLTEDERSDYIVEDIVDGQRDADDSEYDSIDVIIDNEEENEDYN